MSEHAAKAELRRMVVDALERAAKVASMSRTGTEAAQSIREMAAIVAEEDA